MAKFSPTSSRQIQSFWKITTQTINGDKPIRLWVLQHSNRTNFDKDYRKGYFAGEKQFVYYALDKAISSRRFHVASRLELISFPFSSSSWNLREHSSYSSESESAKIFFTFCVKLRTAWFQWLFVFFSKEGKIMGSITFRFCLIRFSTWSLFHKNKALSATYYTLVNQSATIPLFKVYRFSYPMKIFIKNKKIFLKKKQQKKRE